MFVNKTVAFVVFALSALPFSRLAVASEPATFSQNPEVVITASTEEKLQKNGTPKSLLFIDKDGDGLNDLVRDSDGDGIPDGRMCDGSGYGAGWKNFSRQGGGRVMMNYGAGNSASRPGSGKGFGQGRGRR